MEEKVLVSVICITYNHQKYIRQCLESMLCQKTNFAYEIIVHDDASTDGTQDEIRQLQLEYPERIKAILQTENQYSQNRRGTDIASNCAKGKYLALCEGDDCWCDDEKLQKQFDYMEQHPECAICFHNAYTYYDKSDVWEEGWFFWKKRKFKGSGVYTEKELMELSVVPASSFFFKKKDCICYSDFLDGTPMYGDILTTLCMTTKGYGYCLDGLMSVYRREVDGSIFTKAYHGVEAFNYSIQSTINTWKKFDYYSKQANKQFVEAKIEELQRQKVVFCEEEVMELQKNSQKLYIYGTGVYGAVCCEELTNRGIAIEGFVVSSMDHCQAAVYKGYSVKALDVVKKEQGVGFVLAVGPEVRPILIQNLKEAQITLYCTGCCEVENIR